MNIISSIKWLPKSYTYEDFFQSYIHTVEASSEVDGDNEMLIQDDEITNEFDLDNYDDEDMPGEQFFTLSNKDEKLILEDPEDIESRKLDEDDRVIICGNSGEDCASIDFHIYNTAYCGLEACHSVLVGSFPLTLEIIPNLPNHGPLVASGTYESHIDIWDVRYIDLLEPTITLGNDEKSQGLGHKDAVQCLSSSPHVVQLLASGSADNTVKFWDLQEGEVLHTFDHHTSNVQAVQFSPYDPSLILTASFDRTAALCDIREFKHVSRFVLESEVEAAIWRNENTLIISTEDGMVAQYDKRANEPVWRIKAHKKPCTSIDIVGDVMVTCGLDSKAKVYNIDSTKPVKLASKKLRAGPLFSVSSSPDDRNLVGFGGDVVVIWDLETINDGESKE
ncbi:WD domain G-beta repeat family protein [Babesia bovis T2Bo]|uniref:WD domain G-beta repeat family protein n=1 Tax=Babesia bovis T2Bo TaxID=484906 RepID=UPI001C34C83E|nr:WD domain G-beta repeat family protein [Babesia bovis T2Bo]EDO07770.2 WD domain G-beta repeat family protein [Babesia bovis T2Bo]